MPINSFSPPRIVIDTNSPAHAESSPHVRRTLDINRESDIHAVAGTPQTPISIHALRKESDPGTLRLTKRSKNFNPHSPCGERPCWNIRPNAGSYFNPHSPCEERLKPDLSVLKDMQFQSTLPLRGATYSYWISPSVQIFQSTLPLRGATFSMRLVQHIVSISIHTPLAGSDGTARPWSRPCGNFNPHSPCGERQYAYRHPSVKVEISIHTPLAGSDEAGAAVLVKADVISIHTPLAGSDSLLCGRYQYNKFQSTLPLRGATPASRRLRDMIEFQSTLPLRGATHLLPGQPRGKPISIHTPLAGSDRCCSTSVRRR